MKMATSTDKVREWREKNPERWKEHQRNYRRKNRAPCKTCSTPLPYPSAGRVYCEQCSVTARARGNQDCYKRTRQAFLDWKVTQGPCSRCGYNKCLNALDFHHPDPSRKEGRLTIRMWRSKVSELEKECIVLCANCHREEHSRGKNP